MSNSSARLDEKVKTVLGTVGLILTTTVGDAKYVSLKGYAKCQIILVLGDGTSLTAADITLQQATAVAGTNEKPLGFTRMLANVDYGTAQVMAETAVTGNTFKTQTTDSKNSMYIIDVNASSLDVAGGFDCLRLDATAHAATASRGCVVLYNLYEPRFSGITPLTD